SDEAPRVARIRSTRELEMMYISEAFIPEAKQDPSVMILGKPGPMPFDDAGNVTWEEEDGG
ncbi:MAG TPA: hypothetical protein VHR86_03505, partial [Armatimonadota bacterium]|nr:hypothetical protein [Armatimonadota bacterium]